MAQHSVQAVIITIGDELLIGQTVDTNSAFIARELNKIGIWVRQRVAISDDREQILNTLTESAVQARVVIITGGLGPTADDITKPTLCEYFKSDLRLDESVLQNVTKIFGRFGREVTERNRQQAMVPEACTVLPNKRGTAPGMSFEKDGVFYFSLPGVPSEMEGLMNDSVIPMLEEGLELPVIVHKTTVTMGQGESFIADKLQDFEAELPPHIKLAYLPNYGIVKLRLTAKGTDKAKLESEVAAGQQTIKNLLSEYVVADDDVTLAEVVGGLLKKHSRFMCTAESCTGGYIAHLFTQRSGASHTFKGSVVCYSNEIKENPLCVQHSTLVTYGAVSEETVREMAANARVLLKSDYSVVTSGIMGPDGGTQEKPVGTVWIGVANGDEVRTQKFMVHRGQRQKNIEQTAILAMNMLRKFILEKEEG